MAKAVHPFVYWSQTADVVSLRVDLRDTKSPDVLISEKSIEFCANGTGMHGLQQYAFQLQLFDAVNVHKSSHSVTPRHVAITLKKAVRSDELWPRVTVAQQKIAWLKTDFDGLVRNISDSENENAEPHFRGGVPPSASLESDFDAEEDMGVKFQMVYLVFYNAVQTLGFYLIVFKCLFNLFLDPESTTKGFQLLGTQMKFCQGMAFLEIINAVTGIVRSGVVPTILQVLGRNMILFMLIDPNPVVQSHHSVFFLFLVWSLVEIIRYPYYILQTINRKLYVLTWLRYTIWMVLYPLGFCLEFAVMWVALPVVKETSQWSITLPNWYNCAFDFSLLLQAYMAVFFFGAYGLLKYMYQQRRKAIGRPSRSAAAKRK